MKNNISHLMFVCLLFAMTSCGITQKFTVTGKSGTEIYDPLMNKLGVIDNSGKTKIVLNKKDYNRVYVAYLMAHQPGSDAYIPFALNYKNSTLANGKFLGYSLASSAALIGIGAGIISSESTTGGIMLGLGAGYGFASLTVWGVSEAFAGPSTKFRYLKEQNTIQDINFTQPVFNSEIKVLTPMEYETTGARINTQYETIDTGTPLKRKTLGDKSTKSLKDFGKTIEGIYRGSGSLTDTHGNIIEEYADIVIEIARVDNSNVTINVIDDNGEQFFEVPNHYKVSKNSNGSFNLNHKKIKGATIQIDKIGNAIYKHPNVNIDGELYILEIKASVK